MFIYPENLKAKPKLWLWQLRDISIIGICLIGPRDGAAGADVPLCLPVDSGGGCQHFGLSAESGMLSVFTATIL